MSVSCRVSIGFGWSWNPPETTEKKEKIGKISPNPSKIWCDLVGFGRDFIKFDAFSPKSCRESLDLVVWSPKSAKLFWKTSYSRSVWLQQISLINNRHLNQLLPGLNNYTRNRPKLHLKPTKSYWFSLSRSVLVRIGLAWTPLHFLILFPFILLSCWQQDLGGNVW